ncbi:MAG TPA: hypothetical protein VHA80_10760 [Solirubrobacterales bacterium]|nr:hypothetical protein [Solirubrobacterales bacterium]
MAVAVPKRRSSSQAAPAPSRTAPPEPKKRPRDRPKPGGRAAPRKVNLEAPARKPARRPARRKPAPKRRPAGVIPIAAGHAGRAAVAVTQLPESGLIHRLTRGRAWIGVLGVLLVGIVALNVVTLSFAASSGKVDAKNTELSKENSMLQSRVAQKYGQARVRAEAAALGLKMSTDAVPQLIDVRKGDVAEAAARLAAAAPEASGSASVEEGAGEGSAGGEEVAGGEESGYAGEESTATGESEFTPEELAIYEREYAELLAAEGVTEVPAE